MQWILLQITLGRNPLVIKIEVFIEADQKDWYTKMERKNEMIKIEVYLEEEQMKELFENVEVRFSKKKLKELQALIVDQDLDIKERLEEALAEYIEEIIQE